MSHWKTWILPQGRQKCVWRTHQSSLTDTKTLEVMKNWCNKIVPSIALIVSTLFKNTFLQLFHQNDESLGYPSWPCGRESAWQCSGHRFDPWSGKIPHAAEQPSLCTWAPEPVRHKDWLQLLKPAPPRTCAPQQEKSPQWDTQALQLEEPPLATTRERLSAAVKTQHSKK